VAEDKAATADMAVVVDAAKAVLAAVAADVKLADRAVLAAVPVDLVAANGNSSARRKSANFVSRKWI
jgi:hypothetical protein